MLITLQLTAAVTRAFAEGSELPLLTAVSGVITVRGGFFLYAVIWPVEIPFDSSQRFPFRRRSAAPG